MSLFTDDEDFAYEYLADHMLRTSRVLSEAHDRVRALASVDGFGCDLNEQMRCVASIIRPALESTSPSAVIACGELWARAANAIVEELHPGLIAEELAFRAQREQRELEWALTNGRQSAGFDPEDTPEVI